jgi:hypothetical protein
MLHTAIIIVLLSSEAARLFVGVETAAPIFCTGPDTKYYTGDLFPRQRGPAAAETTADANAPPPLLLPPSVGIQSEVYQSNAPAQPARSEMAGVSHHILLRLRAGLDDCMRSRSASAGKSDDHPTDSPEEAEGKAVRAGMAGQDDHYEILGLADLRWRATDDQIKKAYHRTSLRCHPDKVLGAGEDAQKAADEHYKKVNLAYAVLTDRQKRMGYDSLDTTHDMLPTAEEVQEGGFYEVMSYYFSLNARWSLDKRVPALGDVSTPLSEVERFYDFWEGFKSWRDFSIAGEHDPELASNRYQRRQMIKENEKVSHVCVCVCVFVCVCVCVCVYTTVANTQKKEIFRVLMTFARCTGQKGDVC